MNIVSKFEYSIQKLFFFVVILFFEDNDLSFADVTFHDKSTWFKAIATQQLLKHNNIDFFDNNLWLGSSPDLNAPENLGAILKKPVKYKIVMIPSIERNSFETIKEHNFGRSN